MAARAIVVRKRSPQVPLPGSRNGRRAYLSEPNLRDKICTWTTTLLAPKLLPPF